LASAYDLEHHRYADARPSQTAHRAAHRLTRHHREGTQNMLCAYLAAGVLTGLALNPAFGVWRADPAVALGIAALAVNEGRHAWAGEDCCAASPIPTADSCPEDRCR
jgi:hypothetical protein